MGSLVVVAVPAEDDPVWKISSEKVPHLTILFLGEAEAQEDLEGIMQFVEHASSVTLNRFGMSVDRRGKLGMDQADVLFFDKAWAKDLVLFRGQLLQNGSIRKAYDSVEQFPEWTPHLTLGYPDSPANSDEQDHPIGWVNFDRIAVWVGDSVGPEFLLKQNDWGDLAMSDTTPEIRHYGVKGMKWGQRNAARTQEIKSARVKNHAAAQKVELANTKVYAAPNAKARQKERAKANQLRKEYLRNPDRATANKLTAGEMAAAAVFASIPITSIPTVAAVGTMYGTRKATERRARKAAAA